MSAYLEHRLRGAGIEAPRSVCIAAARDSWVFTDIADDLEWTYPGVRVFDRSAPDDRKIAEGGYGAGTPRAGHIDCFESGEGR